MLFKTNERIRMLCFQLIVFGCGFHRQRQGDRFILSLFRCREGHFFRIGNCCIWSLLFLNLGIDLAWGC